MKIFEIARVLNRSEMCKGVTLSFQSMDDHTLDVIKRANIRMTDFARLMQRYRNDGIPTYTEVILGLPGESYASFVKGIDQLIAAGQHDSLNIYNCIVLPNAEIGDPGYREIHGIKTVRAPVLLTHCTPSTDPIAEFNEIVVETATMPLDDWQRAYLLSWAVQCFHCLSLTQYLALFLFTEFGLPYGTFYEKLLEFARQDPDGLTGRQYRCVSDIVAGVIRGGSWGLVIPKYGNILWPPEEAMFLNIICEKNRFYDEMSEFIKQLVREVSLTLDEAVLRDLLKYQANMVIDPFSPRTFEIELGHDLHAYFLEAYLGRRVALTEVASILEVDAHAEYGGDLETYAREVVWYGRKGGRFRHSRVIETVKQAAEK